MSTALDRDLRRIKETVEILSGERGAADKPRRAVRFEDLQGLSLGGGGDSKPSVTKVSQLENDAGFVNTDQARQAAPIQSLQPGDGIEIDATDPKNPKIKAVGGSGGGPANTDELPEGDTNLYFTDARAGSVAEEEVADAIDKGETGAGGDPSWANVVSLMHFDGVDGGIAFPDEVGTTWTTAGTVTTETDKVKFGTAAGLFGAGYLLSPVGTIFSFGTADFTIETWFYTSTKDIVLLDMRPQSSPGLVVYVHPDGYLGAYCNQGAVVTVLATSNVADGNWHHVAYVRRSGVFYIYVDGVMEGQGLLPNNLSAATRGTLGAANTTGQKWVGGIDEFRVTKGVARYTANFTPPDAPFVNYANVPFSDGLSLKYDRVRKAMSGKNLDKGSVAVAAHTAEADPHPQYRRGLPNANITISVTLGVFHASKFLNCTAGSPINITVPQDAAAAIPLETEIVVRQTGAGSVTFLTGAGVTLTRLATRLAVIEGQYGVVRLRKIAANQWALFGDLAPA